MKTKAKGMQNPACRRPIPHATRNTQHASCPAPRPLRTVGAFTLIEIAICLAVIGFALIAIVGILPIGMNTQKANRQETVINQDASVFLNAIRNGEHGLDDLTNYVVAITNYYTRFAGPSGTSQGQNWYTYTDSSTTPKLLLTSGLRIIGLLSTPKYLVQPDSGTYVSNHVVAYVRSMSGPAAEKTPASYTAGVNPVQDIAFSLGLSYRMVSDVVPYFGYDSNGIPVTPTLPSNLPAGVPAGAPGLGRDYARLSENLQANMHDLRLTFLWPLLPNGSSGPGYQVFRTAAAGTLSWTNEFDALGSLPAATNLASIPIDALPTELFFLRPRTYLQVQTP